MFWAEARQRTEPIWQRIFAHPFVRSIGDGSLSLGRFRYYLRQDYVFLIEYARVLAMCVARGRDPATMGRLAELTSATLNGEMQLLRDFAARFDLSPGDLATSEPSPTTRAYTRHLLSVAYGGTLEEIGAATLPCQYGYHEIALRLAADRRPNPQPLYAEWIASYAGPEYGELATWLRDTQDALAARLTLEQVERLHDLYRTGCRYEYLFWEHAWQQEMWPV